MVLKLPHLFVSRSPGKQRKLHFSSVSHTRELKGRLIRLTYYISVFLAARLDAKSCTLTFYLVYSV